MIYADDSEIDADDLVFKTSKINHHEVTEHEVMSKPLKHKIILYNMKSITFNLQIECS